MHNVTSKINIMSFIEEQNAIIIEKLLKDNHNLLNEQCTRKRELKYLKGMIILMQNEIAHLSSTPTNSKPRSKLLKKIKNIFRIEVA